MKFLKSLPISTIFLVAFSSFFPWPLSLDITGQSDFSSLLGPSNSCFAFYASKRKVFNPLVFQSYRQALIKKGKMTNDDIRAATETPEHFLAMIEALSADQNYRGLDFQAKLEDLPAKDLKRLQTTIRKYTSESALHKGLHALFGKNKDIAISGLRFPELMVQIYRIVHRPTGFWRNLYRTQNLSETFNKIDDAFIQERIEMALFNESMEETFGVILKDPSLKKRFTAFLSENAAWVDTAIFTALWGATVGSKLYLGMEIDPTSWDSFIELLPPYLPGLGQCLNSKYLAIKWPSHAKKA